MLAGFLPTYTTISPIRGGLDAKECIFNLHSIFQAGRRGFESHLPLHFQELKKTLQFLVIPLIPLSRVC